MKCMTSLELWKSARKRINSNKGHWKYEKYMHGLNPVYN